ncbi:MAG: UDP-N-acetylglucosamine 1-carboxyvinyltransferase [Candidatus Pacebacteria bacterium]|nr:UDP-N-acetylglucosamine 1-carboxyvinyltransferase [Candidatus Paceibacterota bacterium]
MADKFVIEGGRIPKGAIEVMGAKNSSLGILSAALLTEKPCVIDNLPLIEDVLKMIKTIESLGAEIEWLDKRKIKITSKDINPENLPNEIIGRFRGSILTLGPLLARFKKVKTIPPGGCLIGARPIDTHLDAFSQAGVSISSDKKFYFLEETPDFKSFYQNPFIIDKKDLKDKAKEIILKEFSVTATENILLYSSLKDRKTIIRIADSDYEIQELSSVLEQMGAEIKGTGTHTIKIKGRKKLKGFTHKIMPDPIETGTFIVLALASGGEIKIDNAQLSFLELFLKRIRDFGAKFEVLSPNSIKVFSSKKLKMDKVQSLPYPGIQTDLQPELGVLATQSQGPTLIHDPLYEGRLKYLEELNKMGADIIFCDPHRAIINGPTPLFGVEIPSPDLRAGAALVIAGVIASDITVIENVYQIDRGYERLEERLSLLGIDIKRIK